MSLTEAVLEALGLPARREGNRVWVERCPLPDHGKVNEAHLWQNFSVRPDRGAWSPFFCFSCRGSGTLVDLVATLRGVDRVAALGWVRKLGTEPEKPPFLRVRAELARAPGSIELPEGVEKLGAPLSEWNSVPRDYARSRGLTDDQVRRWGIGYALSGRLEGRIFLPVRDQLGRLANYAARTFVGEDPRYLAAGTWEGPDKSCLFGESAWPAPDRRGTVVLFEGGLTGLAIERSLGRTRVSLGGMGGLDEQSGGQVDVRTLTKLATFRTVIIATDPDEAGRRVASAVEHALRKRCRTARLELPDGVDACELSVRPGGLTELSGYVLRALSTLGAVTVVE